MYRRRFYGGRSNGSYAPRRRQPQRIDISRYIKKASIQEGVDNHLPKTSFVDLPIDTQLKINIQDKGYISLTAIQEKAIPAVLEGHDVVGIANTGTGKTAAFLIPLLDRISKNDTERVIVIVPTRELAMQIRDEIREFCRTMNIYSVLCIGGASISNQIHELRRDPHFIIGTPGRLKDLIERRVLDISQFGTIVLDEVDTMLDLGFVRDIQYLISLLPKQRQSLFFSATLSSQIHTLIGSFVKDQITISVKTQEGTEHIDQDVVRVNGGSKIEILANLLKGEDFKKVLIFGRTKYGVERLSLDLYRQGFKVSSIHGDKPQYKRTQAIRMFQEDLIQILVATDVASRGIDITDITHVINYDQPDTYNDYIHRIGRTGRAQKKGTALTFID